MITFNTASRLAADLAGKVDPNEAAKALAYLRSTRNGKELFEYLRAINRYGDVVMRSRQTQRYYQEMLTACERHLRPLQDNYDEMAQTLGWAIRLLRYYRAVPEYQPSYTATQTLAAMPVAPAPQPVRSLPEIGDVFTGPILDVDESAVIIAITGFTQEQAMGVIKADVMGSRKYKVGNRARVEVVSMHTRKNGRVIVELKPVGG